VKNAANPARPPSGTSPKATKTPDLSEPTSERNGYSAMTSVRSARRAEVQPTAASWDSHRWQPRFQGLLFSMAGLALLPATAATVMRVLPPAEEPTVQLAAFIPYGLFGYLLAVVFLLVALTRARRRLVPAVITTAVVALTSLHLSWLAPLFVNDHRAAATGEFRLLSLNMSRSDSDSKEVAERAAQADVVILVETTPAALTALQPFGWDERFRYSVGAPKGDFADTAVYSPLPVEPQHIDRRNYFPAVGDDRACLQCRWYPADRGPSLQPFLRW
jgi:F0F1-type ATP synthase assembly protein I